MRRIESFEDELRGIARYELPDGRWVDLPAKAIRRYGLGEVMRAMGLGDLLPTKPIKVIWCGQQVGTVPADFDPWNVKSRSFFYDPRPGDFRWDGGDVLVASKSLGPGDLESVVGFVPDRTPPSPFAYSTMV